MRVLITGATGFVGGTLARRIAGAASFAVVAPVRRPLEHPGVDTVLVEGIGPGTDWSTALRGVEAVIHCAARVHQMDDRASDPLEAFRQVNVEGTRKLAASAAAAGVRRMVFLSSVKVHGEAGRPGEPFRETDEPTPADPYAVSKLEAEEVLRDLSARTGMETVIIRPPLVYGPEAKANMLRLLKVVAKGVPLPLGALRNKRSMVGIANLCSALTTALTHPAAANRTFLVSDQEDISTPELVRMMAAAMGRPARLVPVPLGVLTLAGRLAGRAQDVERLAGSLEIDSGLISRELGWHPELTLTEGISEMAAAFFRDMAGSKTL